MNLHAECQHSSRGTKLLRSSLLKRFFPIIPMGAIRYSRLAQTYILPAKERRLLGKFQAYCFRTERLICVEPDGQTDMSRSTRLVMLVKSIYTLWGRKRLLYCVANF